ncbi:hypothetical protein [Pseudoteredinibacter isoporae]|uniref:hypothetical protein n=1 Tax=Pseudoteredinibacter isoporae TaxID=570281 RepID=UPI00141EB4B4|nr:hypothetical protein [Pseudoteredinibacter isoporae]NHO88214.1 hypothetical protein [Pseudoteredinibacter isoporae]NIB23455.1 hypothetical protein [Pseudoteredinibacter isoporae]
MAIKRENSVGFKLIEMSIFVANHQPGQPKNSTVHASLYFRQGEIAFSDGWASLQIKVSKKLSIFIAVAALAVKHLKRFWFKAQREKGCKCALGDGHRRVSSECSITTSGNSGNGRYVGQPYCDASDIENG